MIKSRTGNLDADRLIAALMSSCELAKRKGVAIEIPSEKQTIYTFPMPAKPLMLDDMLHQMSYKNGKYEVSGWPDMDPLCGEAAYAERVVGLGSPKNKNGVVFDYSLKKIDENTFDWGVHRQAADINTFRITLKGDLVSTIDWGNGLVFEVKYGPLSDSLERTHQRILIEAKMQYLAVGQQIWDMSVPEAKAFCKKHGLTLLVGAEDGTYLFPSGPPGGKSDPKRMIVNTSDGKIVGVWTE